MAPDLPNIRWRLYNSMIKFWINRKSSDDKLDEAMNGLLSFVRSYHLSLTEVYEIARGDGSKSLVDF